MKSYGLRGKDIPDYGMYTNAGDSRIHTLKKRLVARAKKLGEKQTTKQIEEMVNFYNSQMAQIEEKYPECFDTEPRDCLFYFLKRECPNFDWEIVE